MPETRSTVLAAVRGWFLAAGKSGGLTNAQVILGDSEGLRPAPPFAELRVIVYRGTGVGDPERVAKATGDTVTHYVRTAHRDTVSINVYGTGAEEWLARAVDFLDQPSTRASLRTAGVDIEPLGGMNNLSGVLDDRMEWRFQQDFEVTYLSLSDGQTVTELDVVSVAEDVLDTTFVAEAP
jgi:hypothetical protein